MNFTSNTTAQRPNRYGQPPATGKKARQKNKAYLQSLKADRRKYQLAMSASPKDSYQWTQAKNNLCATETELKKYNAI